MSAIILGHNLIFGSVHAHSVVGLPSGALCVIHGGPEDFLVVDVSWMGRRQRWYAEWEDEANGVIRPSILSKEEYLVFGGRVTSTILKIWCAPIMLVLWLAEKLATSHARWLDEAHLREAGK